MGDVRRPGRRGPAEDRAKGRCVPRPAHRDRSSPYGEGVTDRPPVPHAGVGIPDAPLDGFHAIVPAGGAGTRLWPLSRQGRPKFLLDLTGSGRTLLQQTWDRLLPLTGPEGLTFVTG